MADGAVTDELACRIDTNERQEFPALYRRNLIGRLDVGPLSWLYASLNGLTRQQLFCFLYVCIALFLVLPLAVTDLPPLLDYPNHLARAFILHLGGSDAAIARMYKIEWHIIPNLGLDIALPFLMQWLPIYIAGKVILAAVLLVPFFGVIYYHRTVFGRLHVWPGCVCLIGYNALFLLGFINFLLALGLAFFVVAQWLRLNVTRPRLAIAATACGLVAVFFCHLTGVILAALLMGGLEIEAAEKLARVRVVLLKHLARRSMALFVTFLPVLALYLMAPFSAEHTAMEWSSVLRKMVWLFQPFMNYSLTLDFLSAYIVLAIILFGCWRRAWSIQRHVAYTAAILLVLYFVSPFAAKGGAWVDARFAIMLGFVLFAGVKPKSDHIVFGRIAASALLGLFLVRTGVVASVWSHHAIEIADLREVLAPVKPNERVLVVRVTPSDHPLYWDSVATGRQITLSEPTEMHEAALLLIEHQAFWPLLFANPAQQPVRVVSPFAQISDPLGVPPDYTALFRSPSSEDLVEAPYLSDWQTHFDDVLVLDADGAPNLAQRAPERLQRRTSVGLAALYRILPKGEGGQRSAFMQ